MFSTEEIPPDQIAGVEPLWAPFQQSFCVTRSINNLDSARTCPSLRTVTDALVRYIWQQEELPIIRWMELTSSRIEMVRAGLARHFGCDTDEISIVRNSTEALQILLLGIPLDAGDEVLTTTQDYGSMLAALEYRQRRDSVTVNRIDLPTPPESMDQIVDLFRQAITPRTRLILVSHMVNLTGQILPVARICDMARNQGIEVIVDGAQSFGHLNFKQADLKCDYFGTSLHKYMYAPRGTGMLFIRREKVAAVPPLMGGAIAGQGIDDIRKFEGVGIQSTARPLAIGEAVAFQDLVGPERKQARLYYLKQRWMDRFNRIDSMRINTRSEPEMSCGIGNFRIEGVDSGSLRDFLWDKHRIEVQNIGQFGSTIRVSANLYTTLSELDHFCDVIEDVAQKGLPDSYKKD
ncbi:MAG: aminotransferase class V-fold PLP-dependent enzyme [Candidatus Latescibacteria bacterium]|jgi:isopenicillin-N epimerase|nr:aminotransferase class V-fold PLP-dependent enzyme [Candidatus Latescibacterota bacterium]